MESSEESAAVAAATAARMRRLKEIEQLKQLRAQMENMNVIPSHQPVPASSVAPSRSPPHPSPSPLPLPVSLPTQPSTLLSKQRNETQSSERNNVAPPTSLARRTISDNVSVPSIVPAPVHSNRTSHAQEESHIPRPGVVSSIPVPVRSKSAFAIRSDELNNKKEVSDAVSSSDSHQSSVTSRQPPAAALKNPHTTHSKMSTPSPPAPSATTITNVSPSALTKGPVPSVSTSESKRHSPPAASSNSHTSAERTRKDTTSSAAAALRPQQSASTSSSPSAASIMAPSGRATVAGHYSNSSQPQKSQARTSIRSASTNTNTRPNPAAGLATAAAISNSSASEEMTEAQKAAYLLRMQFLGTKVFVDPQAAAKANRALAAGRSENHHASKPSSSSETSPVRSHSVSVAPVDPHARFLAPTASRLQSVAPTPPTVDEILEQEEQAAQALEAKLRAQRERMEKSKKEVAKYKAEQAVKEANQREAVARAEEEAKASEQRRRETDRVRRDAEKKKVAAFQQAKLARENAKAVAEARKAEVETNERKRAVDAYLKSKAQQQAQQESYERSRLEAIEQRIKQIAPNTEPIPAAAAIAAPTGNTYAFPVPMQQERKPAAAVARKPKPAAVSSTNHHGASMVTRSPPTILHVPDTAHSPLAAFTAPLSPLTSESVSFFSSTADVTAAFIAAQQEKEKKVSASKPGTKSSGSYAAIHLSDKEGSTKPATKSKRLSGSSRPTAATATNPQSRISDIESALEAEMDQYADDIIFEAEEEDQP